MSTIAKSELFPKLKDVYFADKDPDSITKELISLYESVSGRTLARADPVRLFIDTIILAIVQQRNVIDHAAKMNLLAYAEGAYLEHIGALLGVTRLSATSAVCTLRFTLEQALNYGVVIPAGTRVSSGDGKAFATIDEVSIPAGSLYVDEEARCIEPGEAGNGYVAGQVNKLVDMLPFGVKVENISETSGGADVEPDENLRERIQIAPESFSVAGPVEAYKYFARSANPDISDVAVVGPPETPPGVVRIYPLMAGGLLPSSEVLASVLEACNADNVRPDTDYVYALSPVVVNYSVDLTYWIDSNDAVKAAYFRAGIEQAIQDWEAWQKRILGRDINPSELIHRVIDAGAKRCEVRTPSFRVLRDWEVAICTARNVVYGGLEKG